MTWVKIMIDMPLPTPRSVMSSPSHMITAVPAVMVMTMTRNVWVPLLCSRSLVAALEQVAGAGQRHDAGRLEQREAEGEVAGVLGDLGLAGLALLLEGLQPRDHHDQQLQDDARRDVGHDPEREDRQLEQRAAGEQVDQVVDAGVVDVADARLDVGDVDARGGICEPARKTTMIIRTNSSLRRRSGVRKAFTNALSTRFPTPFSRRSGSRRTTTPALRPRVSLTTSHWATAQATVTVPPAASIFSLADAGERLGGDVDLDREVALAEHLDGLALRTAPLATSVVDGRRRHRRGRAR